ncbi:dihydroorotate dehydrogenase [Candidatus Peregrinibacteria bacterium CG_4_10_14_0_2_um_filter_43_11]|nr:MAG: dihydroorotate dehydrogenase [Candidatus Peregrinibacteria bacterium CG_4_10_14_0_2_um_filter_43_11]
MNLNVNFCGINFPNPTVLASGYLGVTGASLINCVNHGCGGVTGKTLFLEERSGHPNPTVLTFQGGIINAIGLCGEGVKNAGHEFEKYKEANPDNPLIGSVGGGNMEALVECAQIMDSYPVDLIELNFSCPNVHDEMGRPFACDPKMTFDATTAVRKVTKKPISVKLSPNVSNIGLIAKQAEAAGADAITAVNTMGPGMLIDIHMRRPVLANKVGGVGGYAITPIALRCVYDIYKAVQIPIIGTGGVITGENAIAMLMAGASLLGIGSAIAYYDMTAFEMITDKIRAFMKEEGFNDVSELVGLAHQ